MTQANTEAELIIQEVRELRSGAELTRDEVKVRLERIEAALERLAIAVQANRCQIRYGVEA
jgi:hypothetical protein